MPDGRRQRSRKPREKHSEQRVAHEQEVEFSLPEATEALLATRLNREVEKRDNRGRIKQWRYDILPDYDNLFLSFFRLVPKDPKGQFDGHGHRYLSAIASRWNQEGSWRNHSVDIVKRAVRLVASYEARDFTVRVPTFVTDSRLVIGLGYKNALEVGLTLHPVYGFPYLPGTAVKGVARAWAEQADKTDPKLRKSIFGSETKDERSDSEKQLGEVTFFDAYPVKFPELKVDIMNPHYPDYYQKDEAPGDWQDPKPIPFLTVEAGTEFRFVLAGRDEKLVGTAEEWLLNGLTWLGIGGKTSAGYGYFRTLESTSEPAQGGETVRREETESPPADRPAPPGPTSPASGAEIASAPTDPSGLSKTRNIDRKTTGIPARIVSRQGRQLFVKLHADSYEADQILMVGQFNPDGYEIDEWVVVDVDEFPKKKKRATRVRYVRRYRTGS